MLHSSCIIHPDTKLTQKYVAERLKKMHIHPVDILNLNSDAITISDVRKLQSFLANKPFSSPYKVAAIWADNLNLVAQQALLKTLEEPPAKSLIFLIVAHKNKLLPTILSRCQLIILNSVQKELSVQDQANSDQIVSFWSDLVSKSVGERLNSASVVPKTRDEASTWLTQQILILRIQLLNLHLKKEEKLLPLDRQTTLHLIEALTQAQKKVKQNLSLKLVFDHLFIETM